MSSSPLILKDPSDVIYSIKEIVGYSQAQYPSPDQIKERNAAIDRRIYRLVMEALRRNNGYIDLNRAHEKYYNAIQHAFANHPDEIQIFACYHLKFDLDTNNHSGIMEPFYITAANRKGLFNPEKGIR